MNVSVVGLGRLGLPFSFFLASKGHKVLAYDKDVSIRSKVNKKYYNIEPNLTITGFYYKNTSNIIAYPKNILNQDIVNDSFHDKLLNILNKHLKNQICLKKSFISQDKMNPLSLVEVKSIFFYNVQNVFI